MMEHGSGRRVPRWGLGVLAVVVGLTTALFAGGQPLTLRSHSTALDISPGVALAAGTWVRTSLEGSGVRLFSPISGALLAYADGGRLHRSDDAGTTWHRIVFPKSPPSPPRTPDGVETTAKVLAVDPTNHAILYIAILDGLYKSEDEGATWTRVFEALPDRSSESIQAIAVSPPDPHLITLGLAYSSSGSGMVRSRDGGTTWQEVQLSRSDCQWRTQSLIPHPTDAQRLFATFGCENAAVPMQSRDQGETWTSLTSELPGRGIHLVGGQGAAPGRWYLRSGAGLHRSDDDGATWTQVVTERLDSVAYDPASPDTVYVGAIDTVKVSRDAGATWTEVADDVNAVYTTSYSTQIRDLLLGLDGKHLFAMTNKGVYRLALHE